MTTRSEVKAFFINDMKNHKMEILKDDGFYRHLKFKEQGTINHMFEIVTWPGNLCITGDMGCYTFERLTDMFVFFRRDDMSIKDCYWSEKLCDPKPNHKSFCHDLLHDALLSSVEGNEWPDDAAKAAKEMIEGISQNDEAHHYVSSFSFDSDDGETYTFLDSWEMNFQDYSYHFRWLLFAIVYGISQYDAEKNTKGTENE